MSSIPKTLLTPEQYLEIERKAEFKSEYLQGEMFAMSGVKRQHDRIVANLTIAMGSRLLDSPCELHTSDMRVRIPAANVFTYPDLTVVCGEPRYLDEEVDTLMNPALI